MADESSDSEKTEDPTPARREDFRKKGQVAQTRELGSVLTLFGASAFIYMAAGYMGGHFEEIFLHALGADMMSLVQRDEPVESLAFMFYKASYIVLPPFFLFLVLGVMSNILQVGILQNEEALQPNLNRINPVEGLKKLFSLRSVVEGVKAVLKVSLVACVVIVIVRQELFTIPSMLQQGVDTVFAYMGSLVVRMLAGVGVLMLIIAALDYGFQKFDLEKKMRMTKQEVKEEMKSREGDPMVKARIRKIQRDMSRRRMMDDVPTADVIITNPTHLAIALKYDSTLPAPQLVAKGAGVIAQRIKDIAKENKIPIVENKPLARTIYKTLEIGNVVPRELYKAVAEVLSYVYKIKRRVMG